MSEAGNGDRRILRRVTFALGREERVLITGPNGAGKTTLLNVIAGVTPLAEGEAHIPSHVRIGYLRQEYGFPDPRATVLEYFRAELPGVREEHIATLLSYQLLRFDEFNLSVGSLSPGQARKLMIARLLAERPNLLLLDEPTNHVSFSIMEEFERAVDEFPGPIIAVSHDRWFTRQFRGAVWTLLDGVLTPPPTTDVTQEDAARMRAEIAELSQYSPPDA
ncbi:MAG: ATP-binding cassette domain-containing protein [Bacilli bacterium]